MHGIVDVQSACLLVIHFKVTRTWFYESHSDDLCSELKLGAEYSVIGVAVPQDVEVPSWSDPSGHATMPVMVEVRHCSLHAVKLSVIACIQSMHFPLFMNQSSLWLHDMHDMTVHFQFHVLRCCVLLCV